MMVRVARMDGHFVTLKVAEDNLAYVGPFHFYNPLHLVGAAIYKWEQRRTAKRHQWWSSIEPDVSKYSVIPCETDKDGFLPSWASSPPQQD